MTEAEFERKVVKEMKARGTLSIKLNGPGQRGWPDRLFIRGARVVFVEFKTDKGRVSAPQRWAMKQLKARGFKPFVARPAMTLETVCYLIEMRFQ